LFSLATVVILILKTLPKEEALPKDYNYEWEMAIVL